jgi:hypothetical protein
VRPVHQTTRLVLLTVVLLEAGLSHAQDLGKPVPATRMAVFRPPADQQQTATWLIWNPYKFTTQTVHFGRKGDMPVPAHYLATNTGQAQLAVFRPSMGQWIIRNDKGFFLPAESLGRDCDQPVPANYLSPDRAQIAIYRPSTGEWIIRRDDGTEWHPTLPWQAQAGDVPVPAHYLATGTSRAAQCAIFRPSSGEWMINGPPGPNGPLERIRLGEPCDMPVPGPCDMPVPGACDMPVPGAYSTSGHEQIAVYRPTTGEWIIRGVPNTGGGNPKLGREGDTPVPAAYLENQPDRGSADVIDQPSP